MVIRVAKTAGFCFGVARAMDMVEALLTENLQSEEKQEIYSLGEIIHNPQAMQALTARGLHIADGVDEIPDGVTVIARTHGSARSVYALLQEKKARIVDTTCPYVAKIQKIVEQAEQEGKAVWIAGDRNHPEIQGILGYCEQAPSYTFLNQAQLAQIVKNEPRLLKKESVLVAQTTFRVSEWVKCKDYLKKICTSLTVFDTICSATEDRQREAEDLAVQSQLMVVIGGRNSSNTAKLYQVCAARCDHVCHIESAGELDQRLIRHAADIGVTAGASTPACIIKEVIQTMTDIQNNDTLIEREEAAAAQDVQDETTAAAVEEPAEFDFEQALEESLKPLNTGSRMKGTVVSVSPTEVHVDLGRKYSGFIPTSELTDDPSVNSEDVVKVGDEIEVYVMRVNDVEGTVMLSKKRIDQAKNWDEIEAAEANDTVMNGVVRSVVKGGVIALANGIRIFIPASHTGLAQGENLEQLVNQKIDFKIIEVNRKRRRAVGSVRVLLRERRAKLAEVFWAEAEVGKHYQGTVKSLTSYGAFVDLGGVDGMVHISELSWTRISHPSEVVKVGNVIDVYIKDIDPESKRISLGYKKDEDNPWNIFTANYHTGDEVTVKVTKMMPFGAFAQIIPGIDGLVHISQISDRRIAKPQDVFEIGQEVQVRIMEIDQEKKRISLSRRALIEDGILDADPEPAAKEAAPIDDEQ